MEAEEEQEQEREREREERLLLVLYGSQSGCAQEVASRIEREARAHHFRPEMLCLDDYDVRKLPSERRCVVFVASTTGQGECPDNMKRFWRFLLRKSLPSNSLQHVKFTVFGLGDSSYPIYNAVARRLYQRLLDLGANSFHKRGLGDDQHELGVDGALDEWLTGLWSSLLYLHPLPPGLVLSDIHQLAPPRYSVQPLDGATTAAADDELGAFGHGVNEYMPLNVLVCENRRLTGAEHFQDVRHIEFDIADVADGVLSCYEPGDVLVVHPTNPPDQVDFFIRDILGREPQEVVEIGRVDATAPDVRLPVRLSLLQLCSRYLDICGTPRRFFFEMLAKFASNELEKERLEELCSSEGQIDLYAYNHKERRTYVEVLSDFRSAIFPLDYLVELIPRLQPRQFSISSSPLAHPGRIHITLAVLEFTTPYQRHKTGVCSQFLRSRRPMLDKVPVWCRRGSIRLRSHSLQPLLLVGTGTGIAPFRSMIHELDALRSSTSIAHAEARTEAETEAETRTAPATLFVGCRAREQDFLYADEWPAFVSSGTLERLVTAFSRDQAYKIYVQDRIRECGEHVWHLLSERDAIFCLSGSAKQMPADVRAALLDVIREHGGLDAKQSEAFLKDLQKKARYFVECWA